MSERPILFTGPMVRALLDGRKIQTRRAVKPRGRCSLFDVEPDGSPVWTDSYILDPGNAEWRMRDNPYGVPGDRLWVREAWRTGFAWDGDPPSKIAPHSSVSYEADGNGMTGRRRSFLYMPRWASRLTLIVEEVRLQRLQQISEADALAEGIIEYEADREEGGDPAEYAWDEERGRGEIFWGARDAYESLWNHINGPGSWAANPWVWVVSFEVVK